MRRFGAWGTSLSLLALLIAQPGPAWADPDSYLLPVGQPAPVSGVLFPEPEAKRLVEALRDLLTAKAVVDTLTAESRLQAEQILALKGALDAMTQAEQARAVALAVAEDRDQRRKEIQEQFVTLLREQRETLAEARAAIKDLQLELRWTRIMAIAGPLGLILLLFMGGR